MAESVSPKPRRDWLSVLGMAAVAGAAAFTSYSGLDGLAHLAGWPGRLSMMLPVTIDAYAMTATRVWLSPARLTKKARAWARNNAVGAIGTSVLGNALFHAAAAHVLSIAWPVVVGISAIPPVVLGLTVHLWHVADDIEPEPAQRQASPGLAIAEPEAVRAAYPILGDARALSPASVGGRPAPTGGPHRAPGRTPPVGTAEKPTAGPQRPTVQRRQATQQQPTGHAARVLTDEELLERGRELARELGGLPSANQLHLRLSIGPNRARRIADLLAEHTAADHGAAPKRPPASSASQAEHPTGGPTLNTPSQEAAPPVAAPTDLPSPRRPVPTDHANGTPVDAS